MVDHTLQHPDIHRPWSQWSEDATLHIVSVYSNEYRWKSRRKLFNIFRRHMATSANVVLHVVELAYDKRPFEVTSPDNPLDIQLKTDCELWHKENLINLGVRAFPPGWKYGGYLDGDFHMTRQDWALEAIHMLQHYQFVQLFSSYVDLTGEMSTSDAGHRPYRQNSSFAWNYNHQKEFKDRRLGKGVNRKNKTDDDHYGVEIPAGEVFPWGLSPGATGGGWAWRRQAYTAVGGMLERCILGSGDWHMAFGLIGQFGLNIGAEQAHCTPEYIRYVQRWIDRARILNQHPGKGIMGCIDNYATHAFHGSKHDRGYGERWQILQGNHFDPDADVIPDVQGVLRWTGNKPALRDAVRRYFLNRYEDNTSTGGHETPMV